MSFEVKAVKPLIIFHCITSFLCSCGLEHYNGYAIFTIMLPEAIALLVLFVFSVST